MTSRDRLYLALRETLHSLLPLMRGQSTGTTNPHPSFRAPSGYATATLVVANVPLADIAAYSITSSARASRVGGISSPKARAVGRLMTKSNLVDCTTGRSAGLVPLRMRIV
jgi:hypothetical protein